MARLRRRNSSKMPVQAAGVPSVLHRPLAIRPPSTGSFLDYGDAHALAPGSNSSPNTRGGAAGHDHVELLGRGGEAVVTLGLERGRCAQSVEDSPATDTMHTETSITPPRALLRGYPVR